MGKLRYVISERSLVVKVVNGVCSVYSEALLILCGNELAKSMFETLPYKLL